MSETPQGPCCPRIRLGDIGYFSCTTDVTANELLSYLENEVGVNWADYFYPEYPCALHWGGGCLQVYGEFKKTWLDST